MVEFSNWTRSLWTAKQQTRQSLTGWVVHITNESLLIRTVSSRFKIVSFSLPEQQMVVIFREDYHLLITIQPRARILETQPALVEYLTLSVATHLREIRSNRWIWATTGATSARSSEIRRLMRITLWLKLVSIWVVLYARIFSRRMVLKIYISTL